MNKAEKRAHILQGLLIAIENINEVIAIIKSADSNEEAQSKLMEKFSLTKVQARAILEMRLRQLTALAVDDLQAEYDELAKKIKLYKEQLANKVLRWDIVKEELSAIRDKYGDERQTLIQEGSKDISYEELITPESVTISISNDGYIKRIATNAFRTQHRGGKGVKGMKTKEEDHIKHLISSTTHDYILFFTNLGKMHWIKAYNIPESSRTSKGKPAVNILNLEQNEKIQAVIAVEKVDDEEKFIIMATKNGIVKKSLLSAFKHLRKKPIRAINLDEDDDLVEVKLTNGEQRILLATKLGKACHFYESNVRSTGRASRGVRGIRLSDDDSLVSMSVVEQTQNILVVTALGMVKKSTVDDYRITKRGGKGVRNIKLKENDFVVNLLQVSDEDEILVTTKIGQIVRVKTAPIRTIGRASQGVKLMNMKVSNDTIISLTKVAELDLENIQDNIENQDNTLKEED